MKKVIMFGLMTVLSLWSLSAIAGDQTAASLQQIALASMKSEAYLRSIKAKLEGMEKKINTKGSVEIHGKGSYEGFKVVRQLWLERTYRDASPWDQCEEEAKKMAYELKEAKGVNVFAYGCADFEHSDINRGMKADIVVLF